MQQNHLKGIHPEIVEEIFEDHCPKGAAILYEEHNQFIEDSLTSPFIQRQVQIGVYTEQSIYAEFLSPAYSMPSQQLIVVDVLQIERLMAEAIALHARAFCTVVALHEAKHLQETSPNTSGIVEMARDEQRCNKEIERDHPLLWQQASLAMQDSTIFQRVAQRIAALSHT